MVGWDFSWLGERVLHRPLPWDYRATVLEHARRSRDLLDMGTGGGEWLASLPYRPPRTVATEAWEPNLRIARKRLRPLGVEVVHVEGAPDNVDQTGETTTGALPFASESFRLVVNRHEAYVAREVARVLAPGGVFVTQQVGGRYDDFYRVLGLQPPPARPFTLALATEQIEAAGLAVVESQAAEQASMFADVGALAWFLKAIPWIVPGFAIAAHRRRLAELHARITADGPITVRQPAFWLRAEKALAAGD